MSKTKKTILFIDFLPLSGTCTGLLSQVRYMNQVYSDTYRCVILGSKGSVLEMNKEELEYVFYGTEDAVELQDIFHQPLKTFIGYFKTLFFVLRIAILESADVLHCYHYVWSIYANPVAFVLRRPIIIHLKDVWLLQPKISRILMKFNMRAIFISVSKYVHILFTERYKTSKLNTIQIYDGIDTEIFKVFSNNHSQKKFKQKKKKIIMMSRISPERDIEIFIDTAALLIKQYPDLQFIHYGYHGKFSDIIYYKQLKNRIASLHIDKYFKFKDYIVDAKLVAKKYQESFLTVVPARQFALPNVSIESMMCGVPVVAYDVGGNKEIIEHSVTGFLIRDNSSILYADKIKILLSDSHLYESMSEKASISADRKFSATKSFEKIINIYNR